MIEAVLSFVVSKLGDFAQRFQQIHDDCMWLKGEVSMMKALLRDADRRSAADEAVKEWLEQVRNVALKIEDFLDYYTYKENMLKSSGGATHPAPDGASLPVPSRMVNLVSTNWRYSCWVNEMANEIGSIKKEVETISRRVQTYGLHRTRDEGESSGSSSIWRTTQQSFGYSPLFEQVEMVGFDEDVRQIMDWLLSEDNNFIPRSCMCIVGMGGSGKTALAKRVYKLAHSNFDHHLWMTASESSQFFGFLREIQDTKQNSYATKRPDSYVLVVDDIIDVRVCNFVRGALPPYGRGRIIFTSRQNIAPSLVYENCHVHTLKPLSYELAWELFCKKAFRYFSPPGICPDFLDDVATEIVRRCSGLPLAIVLMAGLMSSKGSSPREWKDVLDHFNQELVHNPRLESINTIFQASYNYLPSHLQYCFLYSCLFPKGSAIKRKRIIRLWVAQGFVKEQQRKALEEVANDYFIQLIERSMLEPIISNLTGELVSYRVHEIMYELAVSNFKEAFGLFDEAQIRRMIEKRYLAFHNEAIVTVSDKEYMKARAFLVFKMCNLIQVLPSLIFLRVLCLDDTPIQHLPDQVGNLFHLTYLGLRRTNIFRLPDSLEKLHNLETLDIRGTPVVTLSSGITNIRKLRHLLLKSMKIHCASKLVRMPHGIDNLRLLQTLSGVNADAHFCRELDRLNQLKKLYVRVTGQVAGSIFAGINQMVNLCSLKIECRDTVGNYTNLMLETSQPPPMYLEKLILGGIIMELPLWFGSFNSLRVLHLVNSMLVSDPLSNLSKLPNLVSLILFHAYTGEQMGCGPGGFPKLRHLHITSLIELEEWTPIEEGTMPCIQYLSIVDCGKLKMLPQRFEQLITLQSLELIEMPLEFLRRLTTEDFYKVRHISKITDLHLPSNDFVSASRSCSTNIQRTPQSSTTTGSWLSVDTRRKRKCDSQLPSEDVSGVPG
eukprot:TRINITY_DN13807_c0_g1_i3.p1 TRINITY_DN13807_c0_g1~~TRINITY_DN13807_c0_g1_i3.p1  ORF type:complete len:944 (+),score=120.58 TRINITY_DN13807_c0_g1_i3:677-3508(+)